MGLLLQIMRFCVLLFLKLLRYTCYPLEERWAGDQPKNWDNVRLLVILNHTSLLEFLYGSALPLPYLWKIAGSLTYPVAEETLAHPVFGPLYRSMAPRVVPLSRKRDHTWHRFAAGITEDSIVGILPEGRMKRVGGLDKHGQKMSVKRGIAELIPHFQDKEMLLIYSGGLHHVFQPGQIIPRIFRKIKVTFELVAINSYLEDLKHNLAKFDNDFAGAVQADLESRKEQHIPIWV